MSGIDTELCCKSCNTKLLDIVVFNPKGPRSTFQAKNCPKCGGDSYIKEVEGFTAIDSEFDIKNYDSKVDGELMINIVEF